MSTMRKIGNVVRAPWDGLVAVLGWMRRRLLTLRGVVLLLLLIIGLLVTYYAVSSRHAPFTTDAYVQAYVVQVAARVDGQVVRVHVRENQRVAKGELLFEIDRRPFEHKVARLEAKLAQVVKQVAQLESQLVASRADHDKVIAEEAFAQAIHKQEAAIFKEESTTERRYLDAVQKYKAAQAARAASQAAVRKVEEALAALVGDEHAVVAEVRAELAEARLNLEWTRVYAPADGYVTNVQLRPGSYATAGRPVLTCIDAREWWVVANLRENSLENVSPGHPVGLTFDTYPGRVFPGTVESVGWGVGEGQGVPSGELPTVKDPAKWVRLAQRFQVRIRPELPDDYPLRVGTSATVTVYTRDDHWINPVARTWQRVVTWFDYLF